MLDKLVKIFATLPSLGPKSAKRIVLHLLENSGSMEHLADLLLLAKRSLTLCRLCNNVGESDLCEICSNTGRERSKICVVDSIEDLWNIESSGHYNGLYYVPQRKTGVLHRSVPEIDVSGLLQRVPEEGVDEVILANSPTIKGQTNAFYILDSLRGCIALNQLDIKITVLGRGIPIGSEIDYLDESTIKAAFQSRKAA